MEINSSDGSDRRTLRFERLEQALDDARQLRDAEQAGRLRQTGSWTLGQSLSHLGTWVDYGFDGLPIKIPFFVPWVVRPFRTRILERPMPPGRRIPKVAGGTLAIDPAPTADGMLLFEKAVDRLTQSSPRIPNAMLGTLTHDQWKKLHLRHAELHLSFLRVD